MSKKKFQDIFTPEEMVKEILNFIPIKDGDKILEPTAGDGNMVVTILEKSRAYLRGAAQVSYNRG